MHCCFFCLWLKRQKAVLEHWVSSGRISFLFCSAHATSRSGDLEISLVEPPLPLVPIPTRNFSITRATGKKRKLFLRPVGPGRLCKKKKKNLLLSENYFYVFFVWFLFLRDFILSLFIFVKESCPGAWRDLHVYVWCIGYIESLSASPAYHHHYILYISMSCISRTASLIVQKWGVSYTTWSIIKLTNPHVYHYM